jgi:hypothetical protein
LESGFRVNLSDAFFGSSLKSGVLTTVSHVAVETTLATVQVHALSAGHLTLPEQHFVSPASATARSTVTSLSFLIQHENPETGKKTRIVFDLGIRRNLEKYSEPIQHHAATRRSISTSPDVVKSLAAGGLTPDDIEFVIYSHVSILNLYLLFIVKLTDINRYTGITSASPEISTKAHLSLVQEQVLSCKEHPPPFAAAIPSSNPICYHQDGQSSSQIQILQPCKIRKVKKVHQISTSPGRLT